MSIFRRPDYESEITQFITALKQQKPALEAQQQARLGRLGVAISPLCPGGKARFEDQLLDVITRGEMVEKGRPVKIIGHSGLDAVVEEAG